MPSLAGHPEHCHKALPAVVLLPGAAWLHHADRGLPRSGGARAERGHAGGERGTAALTGLLGWILGWEIMGEGNTGVLQRCLIQRLRREESVSCTPVEPRERHCSKQTVRESREVSG